MVCSRRAAPRAFVAPVILAACRTSAPPAAIDPDLSARVPAATVALAGFDLDRFRESPLYAKLPPAATAILQPFRQARRVLIASTGAEFLTIARGVVPGATQVAPDVALAGAPLLIAAATAPHPPAAILASAEPLAAATPVWIAVRGGGVLPLEGNLANVNNLLRIAEHVTLAVQPRDPTELDLLARCPTPEAALQFEQSFRAIVSLVTATSARQPAASGVLASIRIQRDQRLVHVSLSAPPETLATLLP